MTCVVENVDAAADTGDVADNVQAELAELADSLDLPPGYRAEIINGSVVVSPTPTYDHAEIVTLVHEALPTGRETGFRALQVVTVEIAATGERYVPDLAVFPREVLRGKRREGRPAWIRPAEEAELVVEVVSPYNAGRDRGTGSGVTPGQAFRCT